MKKTLIIRNLNRYTIKTSSDGKWGVLKNGTWTGMVKDIVNKDADIIVAHLSRSFDRSQVLDFTNVLLKFT